MKIRLIRCLALLLLASLSLGANPQDEETVRTAYAKLAYAVQAQTVYRSVMMAPTLTRAELATELQWNLLKFDITDMSSGAIADISAKPYSNFVTNFDTQPTLQI